MHICGAKVYVALLYSEVLLDVPICDGGCCRGRCAPENRALVKVKTVSAKYGGFCR
ncbi:hypothetical protein D3C84_1298150 [compost metagenome]